MNIQIPISPGELIDRITILELKQARIDDRRRLANVSAELANLNRICARTLGPPSSAPPEVRHLHAALAETNRRIWDAENEVRALDRGGAFDARSGEHLRFAETALNIHRLNDERHRLKRALTDYYGSSVIEEKHHEPRAAPPPATSPPPAASPRHDSSEPKSPAP